MDLRKDIYFYADFASFPVSGASNLLYVDSATSLIYTWDGTSYVASGAGGLKYGGLWNANTNNPTITSGVGDTGEYYIVGTAGTTSIDGINDWAIGDWIIFGGSAWQKIDNSDKEGYNTIEDEGTPLTQRSTINFVGSGVTAADSGGKTVVTIATGGLTEFTEAENTAAPNATVPVNSLTPVTATTNADVAIVPKGNGALLADIPDNTTTGGNKRGTNAVDLCLGDRGNANQVASGNYSVVIGGRYVKAAGTASFATGDSCSANGAYSFAAGQSNTINGGYSIGIGGANSTANDNNIAIGYSNTCTNELYAYAFGYGNSVSSRGNTLGIGNTCSGLNSNSIGRSNTASGADATTIGKSNIANAIQATAIGTSATASGTNSTAIGNTAVSSGVGSVAIGTDNTRATADYSVVLGNGHLASAQGAYCLGISSTSSGFRAGSYGNGCTASGQYSHAMGSQASTLGIYGRYSYASGQEAVIGDSQASKFILRNRTTDATATTITTDSGASGAANQVILSNQSAYRFKGTIIGKQSGSVNASVWDVDGFIVRGANAAATTLNVSNVTLVQNTPAWGTPTLAADTTNGGLQVQVTGAAATNIQWTCTIETTEVIYA